MPVLAFEGVVKRFGDFTAVDDLSFDVPESGIFGFLGANGAGKTTSLRMALDILRPNEGRITVLDRPPGRKVGGDIGFLPEERGLYRQMTALETVIYFGQLKGMGPGPARRGAEALLDRFGLSAFADEKVEKLSKGMAQKVQLACALVTEPRLLILDEPFAGLDPVNQEEARARLPTRLSISARADPSGLPGVAQASAAGAVVDGWTDYDVSLAPGASTAALLEACTSGGFPLRRFDTQRASLHDVFLHFVGGEGAQA